MKMGDTLLTDPFATKGIEYLIVIGFLLALTLFWLVLRRPSSLPASVPGGGPGGAGRWFVQPEDLYYHRGHSWLQPGSRELARIGIDDFASKLVGKPTALRLPRVGSHLTMGGQGWTIEVNSKLVDMLSPVDGEVVAVNEEALLRPDLVEADPYGRGWLLEVRPSRIKENLTGLLHGRLATLWMKLTENALRSQVSAGQGAMAQDGGLPVSGMARSLDEDRWDEVAREFLLTK